MPVLLEWPFASVSVISITAVVSYELLKSVLCLALNRRELTGKTVDENIGYSRDYRRPFCKRRTRPDQEL